MLTKARGFIILSGIVIILAVAVAVMRGGSVSNTVEPQTVGNHANIGVTQNFAATAFDQSQHHLTSAKYVKLVTLLQRYHFNGTVLLIHKNQPEYLSGWGYANFQQKRGNGVTTIYQIASVQKSVTAYLIMRLALAHRLKLNDPISKFYPGIPGGQVVTLRQMLNMTSGYRLTQNLLVNATPEQVVTFNLQHLAFNIENYNKFVYQPINYVLLAGIVAKVGRQSYQQQVERYIIKPLHLYHTGFVLTTNQQVVATMPIGYSRLWPKPLPVAYQPYMINREYGTGNMYMSIGDLYRFQRALRQGQLLSTADANQLLFQQTTGSYYTAGAYRSLTTDILHGIENGFETTVMISRNGENAVILMSNVWRSYQQQTRNFITALYPLVA